MCIAIPAKVIEILDDFVKVKQGKTILTVKSLGLDLKPKDYVFIENSFIVEKIPKKEALLCIKEWQKLKNDKSLV